MLLRDFYITLHVIADFCQIALHTFAIPLVDNLQQFFQLRTDLCHLVVGIGVKEDFLQQVVVLIEHPLGYAHVAFEGGTRSILMLHDGSKDEGADEGD